MAREFAAKFDDLDVFKASFALAMELHKKSLEFPKIEQYALANQLCRCSKSISVNIAEGFGKQRNSKKDFARYLIIAIGSADETQVWLRFCFELGYIQQNEYHSWLEEAQKIVRMLQSLYSSVKQSIEMETR